MLIAMVSLGVAILLRSSLAIKPYDYLKKEVFELEYGVESAIKRKW